MLKTEIDVLVIAHNIAVVFDYLPIKEQEEAVRKLRMVEKEYVEEANRIRRRDK